MKSSFLFFISLLFSGLAFTASVFAYRGYLKYCAEVDTLEDQRSFLREENKKLQTDNERIVGSLTNIEKEMNEAAKHREGVLKTSLETYQAQINKLMDEIN